MGWNIIILFTGCNVKDKKTLERKNRHWKYSFKGIAFCSIFFFFFFSSRPSYRRAWELSCTFWNVALLLSPGDYHKEWRTMYITRQLGYLAFSLNDDNLAFVSGKIGSKLTLPALIHFSKNLICGDRIFLATDNQVPARTHKPEFRHKLAFLLSVSYLPRCPCYLCRGSPWPRHTLRPSTLAGKHNASRFGPVCIFHCCCTDRGTPLSKETKKDNRSDLSIESVCTSNKQMRDTQWEQAFRNSTNTVIAHGQKQQHYLRNLILIQVASLIGLTLETPLTCAGQKYLQ